MEARQRLIVALDVDDVREAVELVEQLSPVVDVFKVGIAPFTAYGQAILDKIAEAGKKVFLDLKVHDITNTVLNAAYQAAGKNVFMISPLILNSPYTTAKATSLTTMTTAVEIMIRA